MTSLLPTFNDLLGPALEALTESENIPRADVRAIVSPYRICPLGAHVDHQGGDVLGRTVDTGTVLAFAPLKQPEVRLYSRHFGQSCFSLTEEPDLQHWARYAQAAAHVLARRYPLRHGLVGHVTGTLIGAGLSSSASVGLAYLMALAAVNGISLAADDFVELDRQLENDYLGLKNGILDPATIVHGCPGALLHIETLTGKVHAIADACPPGSVAWIVAYSGLSRQLVQSGYNSRVTECGEAASHLVAGAQRLSDVPRALFDARSGTLPENLRRRAAHYFSEIERVQNGRQAWGAADMEMFGALMNASCESSIRQYESGSPVILDLQNIIISTPGVYGSRFSGGGFAGCVVALVRRDCAHDIAREISERYVAEHPELAAQAAVYVVEMDGGLRFWEGL
jgi:galactokinase/galacturonokinase